MKIVNDDDLVDYLWEQSMDGAEMETGDTDSGLWIGGMTLNGDDYQEIEDADLGDYGEFNHVIITQDSQGFKRAELYETRAEYDEAFGVYEEEYGGFEDEED